MRLSVAMCAVAVSLTGCTAVPRDVAFDGANGSSFALVAADGTHGAISYHYVFQKVDRDTATFSSDKFGISVASGAGTLFKKPEQLATSAQFSGKAVPSGEYALIARWESSAYLRSAEGSACFTQGAPIFRIRKSQIQIIPVGPGNASGTRDPATLERQVETLMAAYPNMVAPISVAPTVGGSPSSRPSPTNAFPRDLSR